MELIFREKIGSGAFATVYKAEDRLGRQLAVKIITPSMRSVADALTHARALARAEHPNVVRIHAVARVQDPAGSDEVDAIVMEYVEGETLSEHLESSTLSLDDVRAYGNQLISGLRHIHAQGLAHGDLHGGNVMVCSSGIKVLDILYSDSLSLLSTTSRDERLKRDMVSLRFLLSDLMRHSEIDPGEATAFQNALTSPSDLSDFEHAFNDTLSDVDAHGDSRALEFCWQRCLDDGFVAGTSYANAMLDETPDAIRSALLKRLVEEDAIRKHHEDYILSLWGSMTDAQRREIIRELGDKLESTVPAGNWGPHIRTIRVLGESTWRILSRVTRLKVENAITNDILSGYKDIYSATGRLRNGALGTWALNLGPLFEDRDRLVENIASMLRMNWYTQNYIAEYLFPLLPKICDTDERRRKIIDAIVVAVANDARLVVNKLTALPRRWQQDIAEARGE
jgi:tRNA A-37 threonylcarbamoyl transferase component Bud32